ncbi:Gfo/Idh/MocA family oxidoreductase, partial [Dolichospermum sp. ST_con]|nr:Gfo/Idh/MocA family oxidoreductase [Dolichospermum sp. ST_con]
MKYLEPLSQNIVVEKIQVLVRNSSKVNPSPKLSWIEITESLKDIDCDAAIIVTPPSISASYAEYFLKKEIPVMIEKPACLSLEEALSLKRVA